MFTLALQVQNVSYELEVDEYLTVPDGKGDIVLKLHDLMADEFMQLDMVLSFDSAYDSYSSDQLSEAYKDDLIMRIAAAIVHDMVDREDILETFEWARYINEKGISKGLRNLPLTKLGEKLLNERRMLDFHRVLFDILYRQLLMAEYNSYGHFENTAQFRMRKPLAFARGTV